VKFSIYATRMGVGAGFKPAHDDNGNGGNGNGGNSVRAAMV
jgi:hypothetical protein